MARPRLDRPEPRLVRIDGRRSWYIRWTEPGSRRSKVVSTGTEDAKPDGDPGPQAVRALEDFRATLAAPPPDPTIGELLDTYARARKGQVVAYSRIEEAIIPLKAHFGDLRPGQLGQDRVRAYRAGRRHARTGALVSPDTLLTELRKLRAAMNHARKHHGIESPHFDLPERPPPRDRFLTRDQGRALARGAGTDHIRLFILIGLASGARRNAILELTWDRVDLDRRRIDFNDPGRARTNKRRAVVPIGEGLAAELAGAREAARSEWVIEWGGARVASVKTGWRHAARAAGVPWATPHIMKHSVVSWLAEDGFTIDRICDLTGTDPKTVRRIYRKFNPDYLFDVAESLDAVTAGIGLRLQCRHKPVEPRERNAKTASRPKGLDTTKSKS